MLQDATGGGTKGGEASSLAMIVPPLVSLNSGPFTVSNNSQPPTPSFIQTIIPSGS